MSVRIAVLIAAATLLAPSAQAQVAATNTIVADDLTSVVMSGVNPTSVVPSYLRFSNTDSVSATATVLLRDAATGNVLTTWTTPSIPTGGTLEQRVSDLLPALPIGAGTAAIGTLVAEVQGHFLGHVQHVVLSPSTGTLLNASNCGMVLMADPLSLPYVSGPGRTDVGGQIRITNASPTAVAVTLTFKDNTGSTSTWTSPQVAAFGAITRNAGEIFAAAGVAATARSLSVVSSAAPAGVALSYTEGLIGLPVQADFSAACMLTSPANPGAVSAGTGMNMPGMTPVPGTTTPATIDPSIMCSAMGMGMMGGMGDLGDMGGMGMGGMGMGTCPTMSAHVPTS